MESRSSSSTHQQQREEGMLSCWGRFKLKYFFYFPWRRRRPTLCATAANPPPTPTTASSSYASGCGNFFGALWWSDSRYRRRSPAGGTGFRYDPIEYAQNFDDGNWDDKDNSNENGFNRGFSSRLAPSPSH